MADIANALATSKPNNPRFQGGKVTRSVESKFDLSTFTPAIGDVYELAGPLSLGDRVSALRPNATNLPALTTATDNDLGFYTKDVNGAFVEIDKDILWDGVSLVSASTDANLLTGKNATLDESKNIGEHLSLGADKEYAGGIFLCLTTNIAPTVTPVLRLVVDIDEATTS